MKTLAFIVAATIAGVSSFVLAQGGIPNERCCGGARFCIILPPCAPVLGSYWVIVSRDSFPGCVDAEGSNFNCTEHMDDCAFITVHSGTPCTLQNQTGTNTLQQWHCDAGSDNCPLSP